LYIESYLTNLLSKDGIAIYYGKFLTFGEANGYFHSLLQNTPWKNDEVVVFGKHIVTKRKLPGTVILTMCIFIQIL
jgi:hypothetical protein